MTITLASAEDLDAALLQEQLQEAVAVLGYCNFILAPLLYINLINPPCSESALLPLQAKHAGSEYTY